ncbi:MAG: arsenate reductase/protein-tyrosine-phosphatase family protein [Desulfotomaculales bacterium]
MFAKCPGSLGNTPTLKVKKCPECGGEVEVFSNDVRVRCDRCGFTVYNDVASCIQWCKYARECVGEELYRKLKKKRIVFLGVENAARSVMAEALAWRLSDSPNLVFLSAGTAPGEKVDDLALSVLQEEEGIKWNGRPKGISRIGPVDVVVRMGEDVPAPEMEKARLVSWDVAPPEEGAADAYRLALKKIRVALENLLKEESSGGEEEKKDH